MKRHSQVIFTKQSRVGESCQMAGAQMNGGTRRIRTLVFLGAISSVVILGANEGLAQSPNAALRIEFRVDNAGNSARPKTVGDCEFTVSRPEEAPLFKFHGSEQVNTVPLAAVDTSQGRMFVVSNVNVPPGYAAVYEGDCNPAGGIEFNNHQPQHQSELSDLV